MLEYPIRDKMIQTGYAAGLDLRVNGEFNVRCRIHWVDLLSFLTAEKN